MNKPLSALNALFAELWQIWCAKPAKTLLYLFLILVFFDALWFVRDQVNILEDWHFTQRQLAVHENRRDSNITVVAMGDGTMAETPMRDLFGRYPFQRNIYGYLIRFMNRAHAESVFLDFAFNGGDDRNHPENDQFFVDATRHSQVPVLSALLGEVTPDVTLSEPDEPAQLFGWQTIPRNNIPLLGGACITNVSHPLTSLLHSPMRFSYVNDAMNIRQVIRAAVLVQFNRLPNDPACEKTIPVPTIPVALTHIRLAKAHGLDPITQPLLPLMATQTDNGRPLSFLSPDKNETWHTVRLYNALPYIRWFGNQDTDLRIKEDECGQQSRGLSDNAGPLLSAINSVVRLARCGDKAFSSEAQTFRIASDAASLRPYAQYELWDVIYSELSLSCPLPQHAQEPACQVFNQHRSSISGKTLKPEQFASQTVLVGTTYTNAGDAHSTIYNSGGMGETKYPGVYILANILDNVLSDTFVRITSGTVDGLIIFGLVITVGLVCYFRPVLHSSIFSLVLLMTYSLVTLWAYKEHNLWLPWAMPVVASIGVYVLSFGVRYWTTERKKQQLRYAFGKYVAKNVMQTIESNPNAVSLGGQRKTLTLMFTDIRGFTSYSEKTAPEEVQQVLTRYFKVMHDIILHRHRGVINKLIGDAIMAYWGFPLAKEDDAVDAVRAALAMKVAMMDWNANPDNPPLRIGVGLHTGDAVIGNVGSEEFMDFTVIGDAVNLAARLESETKALLEEQPCAILISETTYNVVKYAIQCVDKGELVVRGKTQPIRVYEPVEDMGNSDH